MGYSTIDSSEIVDFCESKNESLTNWVRQVKSKSCKVRSMRRRNLRVIALLTNSLSRAENELLSKQRERARRWAELQMDRGFHQSEEEASRKEKERIDNIWNSELSGLNNFFRELDQVKCS